MDQRLIREEIRQIVAEFLAEYTAASEQSWKKHLARYGDGYLLPSKGRFFTTEERDAFTVKAEHYRTRAEKALAEANRDPRGGSRRGANGYSGLDALSLALSLMSAAEAENGRWSGSYLANLDHLLELCFPDCAS